VRARVFIGGFDEPSNIGKVQTTRTTLGVDEAHHHFLTGRCRQLGIGCVTGSGSLRTRRRLAGVGRFGVHRFVGRLAITATTCDDEQAARDDRGERTTAPP
jgi:hypothetical protein